jgi:Na+/H+-dicarboxylate symporter
MTNASTFSLSSFSKTVNRPSITIAAILIGLGLGLMRFPFLQSLRPIGDFYVGLLQICVLPFLLATIPLAVRSALTSHGIGGKGLVRLAIWLLATLMLVILVSILVPSVIFDSLPLDQATTNQIGMLVGVSADQVDIELAINPHISTIASATADAGLLSALPTNIFFALSSNDSMRVIVFAVIFGIGMVVSERQSGASVFSALKHIQAVCILLFDWFNVIAPIGIVALIAPQVALMGPGIYTILAPFVLAYLAASTLLIAVPLVIISIGLRADPRQVVVKMLKPLAFAAATRNTLICAPVALETMKEELQAPAGLCDLFIPIGFAVIRFGNMVHFATATLFIGYLLGRTFGAVDLVMIAAFSVTASFATIGISGLAGLAPLAAVLRPFGLSYELALPLVAIVDPIASMARAMVNVALNCQIPALVAGWKSVEVSVVAASAK